MRAGLRGGAGAQHVRWLVLALLHRWLVPLRPRRRRRYANPPLSACRSRFAYSTTVTIPASPAQARELARGSVASFFGRTVASGGVVPAARPHLPRPAHLRPPPLPSHHRRLPHRRGPQAPAVSWAAGGAMGVGPGH